ncbi:MAG: hypothetical protein JW909_08855 [Planctomycetes bacterium]|nr:hypothetical protein [Planctomycetota bacterium]
MSGDMLIPIILLVIGIGLFFLEAIIPSMGILTVAGVVAATIGIVLAFKVSTTMGIIALVCTVVAIPLAVLFFFYVMKNTSIVLSGEQKDYKSSQSKEHLKGMAGVAVTYLRPSGTAMIDGKRIDVTAEGEFIEEGARVKVTRVDGIKVVVQKVKAD